MPQKFEQIEEILKEIRVLINSPQTNVFWSKYKTAAEILIEINSFINRAKQQDESIVRRWTKT